jgi:nicotinate-nucleotide adenylyltransferase
LSLVTAFTKGAIGILGGTFDPVHFGHLRLAQEVADALSLREVRFIPGGTPPHRATPQTAAADRLAMVKLATADNPLFRVDERETRRSGLSYSVDTLTELRAELGAAQPLVLILGADAFLGFNRWHRWREIFDLAHIAVAHRPGATLADIKDADLAGEFARRRAETVAPVHGAPSGSITIVPITALDISATAIRAAIQARRSVRYLTPAAVITHIEHNCLFLKDIKQ